MNIYIYMYVCTQIYTILGTGHYSTMKMFLILYLRLIHQLPTNRNSSIL